MSRAWVLEAYFANTSGSRMAIPAEAIVVTCCNNQSGRVARSRMPSGLDLSQVVNLVYAVEMVLHASAVAISKTLLPTDASNGWLAWHYIRFQIMRHSRLFDTVSPDAYLRIFLLLRRTTAALQPSHI